MATAAVHVGRAPIIIIIIPRVSISVSVSVVIRVRSVSVVICVRLSVTPYLYPYPIRIRRLLRLVYMLLALVILSHWAGCAFYWLSRWEVESSPYLGVSVATGLVPAVLRDARRGARYGEARDIEQAEARGCPAMHPAMHPAVHPDVYPVRFH